MTHRRKVGVLAGGPSSEREISLMSGEAVYNALLSNGVDPVFIDVDSLGTIEDVIKKTGVEKIFITLHGGAGEDGTIQNILKNMNVPYTGSDPESSKLAMDKLASKAVFEAAGIRVPKYKVFKKGEEIDLSGLGPPVVVKPQHEGSSVGLSIVLRPADIKTAAGKAFTYGRKILVEEFIRGRELTVGILDDRPLPVVEIVPERGCYDYYAKYESANTQYLVPAPISDADYSKAQDTALRAHKALNCRSFSRVDMMLGDDGDIYVLEANTIPGLTSRSLLPKAACAMGIDFCELCKKILDGASI
jgi:D-alanine-D-alanine ligase